MRKFNEKSWIIPLIGGIIALVSLFTPVTTWNPPGEFSIQWMFQLGLRLESFLEFGLWRWDPGLLSLSIALSVIIIVCSITHIILIVIYRRSKRSFQKLKKYWILFAVLIALSTLSWIIMMELYYNASGYTHWLSYLPNWQYYSPSFGVIGPFIGSSLIIIAFFIIKTNNKN
ncbi:MAG: hypothetical protein ACFE9S_12700 [Candidatus Hermodarchaeota archaeon]